MRSICRLENSATEKFSNKLVNKFLGSMGLWEKIVDKPQKDNFFAIG